MNVQALTQSIERGMVADCGHHNVRQKDGTLRYYADLSDAARARKMEAEQTAKRIARRVALVSRSRMFS